MSHRKIDPEGQDVVSSLKTREPAMMDQIVVGFAGLSPTAKKKPLARHGGNP